MLQQTPATVQMQVTIPPDVYPGMPFQVNTPAGAMQVIAPEGTQPGGQMLVNIPSVLQPAVAGMLGTPVNAPQPMQMSAPAFDINEIQDGWYGMEGCPTCCLQKIVFNADKSAITWGPCLCWNILPYPCILPNAFEATPLGSSTFTSGSGEKYVWLTPTRFTQPNWGSNHRKLC